jgi:hypothetical protein
MRVLKPGGMAVACAASAVLPVLTLFLGSAWLLSNASLVQSLTLIAMSVFGSGVIALVEFRSPSTAQSCVGRTVRASLYSPGIGGPDAPEV